MVLIVVNCPSRAFFLYLWDQRHSLLLHTILSHVITHSNTHAHVYKELWKKLNNFAGDGEVIHISCDRSVWKKGFIGFLEMFSKKSVVRIQKISEVAKKSAIVINNSLDRKYAWVVNFVHTSKVEWTVTGWLVIIV